MKTGTIRIAGAAAVGAAIAVTAAGTASAAPAHAPAQGSDATGLSRTQGAVGDTVSTVGKAAHLAPVGQDRALPAGGVLGALSNVSLPRTGTPADQLLDTVTGAVKGVQAQNVQGLPLGGGQAHRSLPIPAGDKVGPATQTVGKVVETVGKAASRSGSTDIGGNLLHQNPLKDVHTASVL